jgi:hypothetical protein
VCVYVCDSCVFTTSLLLECRYCGILLNSSDVWYVLPDSKLLRSVFAYHSEGICTGLMYAVRQSPCSALINLTGQLLQGCVCCRRAIGSIVRIAV